MSETRQLPCSGPRQPGMCRHVLGASHPILRAATAGSWDPEATVAGLAPMSLLYSGSSSTRSDGVLLSMTWELTSDGIRCLLVLSERVYSFEPLPSNVETLGEHLRMNRVENCTVFEVAVGKKASTARFDIGKNSSMGHLTADSSPDCISVRVIALDDFIGSAALLPPDVIKCDIEGAEFDALLGARETLKMFSPTIFLATHGEGMNEQCSRLLHDLNYKTSPIEGVPADQELIAWKDD